MPLIHLASRLFGTPLLIARPKLDVILSVLGPRLGLAETGIQAAVPMPKAKPWSVPGIAVIPVYGTLVKRTVGLEAASGLTSYTELTDTIDAAMDDPDVDGIMLDIDSPGGEASGVFELAEHIRQCATIKPVWAHANDSAFSAAYALAASAQRLTLSQTSGVGSIGVIALHIDQSQHDAKEGLTYTAVYAGEHKNDLSPHAPLSESAHQSLQSEVDRLYSLFVTQVAHMRGLYATAIKATEAGLFFGEDAIKAKLADDVSTFDQALSAFNEHLAATQRLNRQPRASPPRAQQNRLPQLSQSQEFTMHETELNTDTPVALAVSEPVATTESLEPYATGPTLTINPHQEAQAIAELCLLAGQAQRTAEFLGSGMTQAQVRSALLEARSEQPDIQSHITADTGTHSNTNLLLDVTQKLAAKRSHKE